MRRKIYFSFLTFISLFKFSCRTLSSNELKGAADIKDFEPWPNRSIEVCWAPHEFGNLTSLQKAIESNVVKEFARADIKIYGWKSCPLPITVDGPEAIYFGRDGNYTQGLGYKSRGGGVHLDPVEDIYGTGFKNSCTLPGQTFIKQECLVNTAVHEFGHMVGLAHEHDRLDTWNRCFYSAFIGKKTISQLGDFDRNSRMNYCADIDYLFGRKPLELGLSKSDVATIKALYAGTLTTLISDHESSGPFINKENLSVSIATPQTKSYRYQVVSGREIKDIPCRLNGYSADSFPAGQAIQVDLKSLPEGVVKVCVLGTNEGKAEQDPSLYSSVSFILNRRVRAHFVNAPHDETVRPSTQLLVGGEGVVSYLSKIKWISDQNPPFANEDEAFKYLNPCLDEKDYSSARLIKEPILIPKPSSPSYVQIKICVRGIDSKGNTQSADTGTEGQYIFEKI